MPKRILDVGQCGVDGPRVRHVLTQYLQCEVDRADTKEEALEWAETEQYDLVLVNRLLDKDKSAGLEVIAALRELHPKLRVMLVSDSAEAQAEAVKLGAVPGFGKFRLASEATEKLLLAALNPTD